MINRYECDVCGRRRVIRETVSGTPMMLVECFTNECCGWMEWYRTDSNEETPIKSSEIEPKTA